MLLDTLAIFSLTLLLAGAAYLVQGIFILTRQEKIDRFNTAIDEAIDLATAHRHELHEVDMDRYHNSTQWGR